MARINSKTNWVGSDRPLAQDFNRIESNNEQSFYEIDNLSNALDTTNNNLATTNSNLATTNSNLSAETSNRIMADDILQGNINAANTARAAGDSNLQAQVNAKQPSPTTSDSSSLTNYPIGTTVSVFTGTLASGVPLINGSIQVRLLIVGPFMNKEFNSGGTGPLLEGVWRSRGYSGDGYTLAQRVS